MSLSPADLNALMVAVSKHIPNIDILPSVDHQLFTSNPYHNARDKKGTMRLWVGHLRIDASTRVPLWASIDKGTVNYNHSAHEFVNKRKNFELIAPFSLLDRTQGRTRLGELDAAVLWYHVAGGHWPQLWDSKEEVKKFKACPGLTRACDAVKDEMEYAEEQEKKLFVTDGSSEVSYVPREEYDQRSKHMAVLHEEVAVLLRKVTASVRSNHGLAALFRRIHNRGHISYVSLEEKRKVKNAVEEMRRLQ
jgi:hypothetical protein